MTTLSTYLSVTTNIDRWRQITTKNSDVQVETRYFKERFAKILSIDAFIKDRRLFAYALRAFGLDDKLQATALMRRVLEQGVNKPNALAHTLNDRRMLDFAKAFDFVGKGAAALTTSENIEVVVGRYVDEAMRTTQGRQNPGVELALYFRDKAPKLTSIYGLLADKKLLEVVQTALDLSPRMSSQQIDTQARLLKAKISLSDFTDPQKLARFLSRFASMYDLKHTNDAAGSVNANPLLFVAAAQGRGESPGMDLSLLLRRQNLYRNT
jgi:hypothetical protein